MGLTLQSPLEQQVLVLMVLSFVLNLKTDLILGKCSIHFNEMFSISVHHLVLLLNQTHSFAVGVERIVVVHGGDEHLFDFFSNDWYFILEKFVGNGVEHFDQEGGLFLGQLVETVFCIELSVELTLLLNIVGIHEVHRTLFFYYL